MITLNKIVDGISEAIYGEFGDNFEIYTEDVSQGLLPPCFSIVLVRPSTNQFLGKRYYKTNLFCIHYFPSSDDNAKHECLEVQDRLEVCLEYITVNGNLTRGTKMNSEITDGVLSFFVNYDMFVVRKQEAEPEMETLEQETQVKG